MTKSIMNRHGNCTTQKVVMAISLFLLAVAIILNLLPVGPEPDAVYPMANQHVEVKCGYVWD